MSPFCKIRCEDCGPYLVADPDFITIFFLFEVLGRGPSYMLAGMCPYCNRGIVENISEEDARPIIDQIKEQISQSKPDVKPVILCAMHVRRHLRNLVLRNNIEVPVLSYQELAPEFNVQPLATVHSEEALAAAL